MPVEASGTGDVLDKMGGRRGGAGTAIEGNREDAIVEAVADWASEIRVSADGSYVGDPSDPAFCLTGQEIRRPQPPCPCCARPRQADGCSGFCIDGMCGPRHACAETDETCAIKGDRCDPADICIVGFCGQNVVD